MSQDQAMEVPVTRTSRPSGADNGGFVALAAIAAAAGAGAALLLTAGSGHRAQRHKRRERPALALAGFLAGAGLAALLTPESGPTTRQLLGRSLTRIKVGTVARIERLRQANVPGLEPAENPVRSVQELGRDSNETF